MPSNSLPQAQALYANYFLLFGLAPRCIARVTRLENDPHKNLQSVWTTIIDNMIEYRSVRIHSMPLM